MDSAASHPVLRRKVAAAREDQSLRAMSFPKALRLTTPKVADCLFDLPLAVIGVSERRVTQAEAWALFSDDTLLILLDGPEGIIGAAALDSDLVGAVIQQQTTGQVSASKEENRVMTRTDAAMIAPLLNSIMERTSELLETEAERRVMQEFKFGARAEDSRMLSLALDASVFHVFKLSFDIARGVRQAELTFCLPVQELNAPESAKTEQADSVDANLDKIIMSVPTELTAVLCKLRLPFSDLCQFKPGDLIPVAAPTLEQTGLHCHTGRKIGQGKLGQSGGFRAVRIATPGAAAKPPQELVDDNEDAQSIPESVALPVEMAPEPEPEQALPDLPPLEFDDPVDMPMDFAGPIDLPIASD